MTSFHSEHCLALLQPLAWRLLQLLGQLQSELNSGCSWLFEGRTSLPFPFVKGQRYCGPEARSVARKLAVSGCHWQVPSTPAAPGEGARLQPPHHRPVPSLGDSNMFDCKWMFLNVFNAIFPVLNMTTQDSNTEISKLLFFSEHYWFKNLSQQGFGFCAAISVLMWESQFKENLVYWE